MSALALANVEALADDGEGGGGKVYCCGDAGDCMSVIDMDGNILTVVGIKTTFPCAK